MPMIRKFVFLSKRKSLHLISSKPIIPRPQRGNGLYNIAIYRIELERQGPGFYRKRSKDADMGPTF